MPLIAEEVVRQLRGLKIFTLDTITRLSQCSQRTVWRRLHDLNVCTSYNHNARYHTLPGIPQFDENGIWRYKDIGFSRHGNLTCTVRHIVQHSPEGIAAQQLCNILGVSAASLYTFFRGIQGITAHRAGRTLFFLSAQPEARTLQAVRRYDSDYPLRSADAVLVLVDRIKHPDDTIEQCVRRLRPHSCAITPQSVRVLLERHGIVKKTAGKP